MKNRLLLVIAAVLASGPVYADEAGSVLFVKGTVTAERVQTVALAKGDAVFESDTIVTVEASRAQLLMIDGAKLAIRPNSRLRIDEYAQADDSSQATITAREDKAVMSLVKGGFRTITGAIGKDDKTDYEVRTAVGVLGIRGTSYDALYCNSDCAGGAADGLYLGVTDGAIVFRSAVGEIVVTAGQFAFIPVSTQEPEMLDAPPAVLIDDFDARMDADGNAESGSVDNKRTGFDSKLGSRRSPDDSDTGPDSSAPSDDTEGESPKQPVIGVDADGRPVDMTPATPPPSNNGRQIGYSTAPLSRTNQLFSGSQFNEPAQLQLDNNNNVVGFTGPYPGAAAPDAANFDRGSASIVDTGFDAVTVLRWGRWAGGVANATRVSDGADVSIDLSNQSLHWVSGPDQAPPIMPITGTANYTLIGATAPTDNQGNTGVLGSASFFADFTSLVVDSTLVIDIAGSTWNVFGSGNIGAAAGLPSHMFSGSYPDFSISGAITGSGNGQFSGFFSEPGTTSDPDFPGGVGLTYSLQDGQGTTTVSGAAVFGNP